MRNKLHKIVAFISLFVVLVAFSSAYNNGTSVVMTTAVPSSVASVSESANTSIGVLPPGYDTINNVSVRVLMDNAYQSFYGANCNTQASTDMSYVGFPFYSTWGINMTYSYAYVSPTLQDGCSHSYTSPCSSVCGTPQQCISSWYPNIHHKNFSKCLDSFSQNISDSQYDLFVMLTAVPVCGYDSDLGSHAYGSYSSNGYEGVVGVAERYGKYTFATMLQPEQTLRFRTLQHEISHNFGCDDNVCSENELCIMNGGYNNTSFYYIEDIWCTNCKSMFYRGLH